MTVVDGYSADELRPWLLRACKLLDGFAGEGIYIAGDQDPAEFLCDMAEAFGHDELEDLWRVLGAEEEP